MRNWLGASALFTGGLLPEISGSQVSKVFHAFGAISAVIVSNTGGLLPEIQSTLRKPPVKNMRKALYSQYTAGLFFYYGVTQYDIGLMGLWYLHTFLKT
ncbi:unnamed protein product [Lupinus luteus]|uniref:Uncharacterized protein n=1 Tax=Lupinus luteus TaxID=3873 RepID=A0AAV1WCD5_LUPLU